MGLVTLSVTLPARPAPAVPGMPAAAGAGMAGSISGTMTGAQLDMPCSGQPGAQAAGHARTALTTGKGREAAYAAL